MRKIISFVAGVVLSAAMCSAGERAQLPLETIKQPLVLPRGMWQITESCWMEYYHTKEVSDFFWPRGNLSFYPRYAVGKRTEFPVFPLPFVRVRLSRNDMVADSGGLSYRPSVSVEGGVFSFSTRADGPYETIRGTLGLTLKKALSERYWLAAAARGTALVAGDGADGSRNRYWLIGMAGLGYQANRQVSLGLSYDLSRHAQFEAVSAPTFAQGLYLGTDYNPNHNVSLGVSAGFSASFSHSANDYFDDQNWSIRVPVRGTVTCQW